MTRRRRLLMMSHKILIKKSSCGHVFGRLREYLIRVAVRCYWLVRDLLQLLEHLSIVLGSLDDLVLVRMVKVRVAYEGWRVIVLKELLMIWTVAQRPPRQVQRASLSFAARRKFRDSAR